MVRQSLAVTLGSRRLAFGRDGTELSAGEVGYIIANIKKISDAKIGDTKPPLRHE